MKNTLKISYVLTMLGLLLPLSSFAAPLAAVPEHATELRVRAVTNSMEQRKAKPVIEHKKIDERKTAAILAKHRENFEAFKTARVAYLQNPDVFENRKELLVRTIEGLNDHAERTRIQAMRFPVISETLFEAISEIIDADVSELARFSKLALEAVDREALSAVSAQVREHRAVVAEQNLRGLMLLAHIEVLENRGVQVLQERSQALNERIETIAEEGRGELVQLSENLSTRIDEQTDRIVKLKQLVSVGPVTFDILKRAERELAELRKNTLQQYGMTRELISKVRIQE